ncbi:MAG TPA: VOC family protein [Gemmatimonadales bacterium]|nr:VOC family protein [Gemmatimonadales bacterium]
MNTDREHTKAEWRGHPLRWIGSHLGLAALAFAAGSATGKAPSAPDGAVQGAARSPAVTGIGGVFFTSRDPTALREWYRKHLGLNVAEWGGVAFLWSEKGNPGETGYTIWSPFPDTTTHFAPGTHPLMINYRVADLAGLVASLRAAGVQIVGEIEQHPNGAFAWVLDPDGRKVELWEPVPSRRDPYLPAN